jgi:uncharacterized OB-fold protein
VSQEEADPAVVLDAVARADPDARAYWAALDDGLIMLRTCGECGRRHLPPMPSCPHCGRSGALTDRPSSGRGRVYSWVVAYYPFTDEQLGEVPFIIGAIDLEEGPRAFGRINGVGLDADLSDLAVVARPAPGHGGHLPVLTFTPDYEG